jgi:hypothetical protein
MPMKMLEDLSQLDELLGRQLVEERRRELAVLPVRPRLIPVRARIRGAAGVRRGQRSGQEPRRTA